MTDLEIIKRVRAGNTNAYEELVLKYEKRVYAVSLRMLKDEQDALDVTQEVFLKAYMYIGNFNNDSGYFTYLYRIAVNECKTVFARRKRRAEMPLERDDNTEIDLPDPTADVHEKVESDELRLALYEEMDKLDEGFREAMLLRCVYDLSYEQISLQLGVDLGTVKSRIFRGREKLKKSLRDRNLLQ